MHIVRGGNPNTEPECGVMIAPGGNEDHLVIARNVPCEPAPTIKMPEPLHEACFYKGDMVVYWTDLPQEFNVEMLTLDPAIRDCG